MDAGTGIRLRRQIEVINHIQRLYDGKEVDLYQMRFGKAAFDDSLRFPDAADEVLLASVSLKLANIEATLKADVWLAGGRIFSLELNEAPKRYFAGIKLREAQPEVVEVKIFHDQLKLLC